MLREDRHFEVVQTGTVIVARRTSAPFEDVAEVETVHAALLVALAGIPRSQCALVIDLRSAPSRNDPAFEKALAPYRRRLMEGWKHCVALVRSAVGRLQVQRHGREDENAVHVLDDPAAVRALVGHDLDL